MRIGINTLFLIPGHVGGTETYLRRLLEAFARLAGGHEFVLFTNRENVGTFPQTSRRDFQEVPCRVRASCRPARIIYEQRLLPRLAERHRLDLLFSPGYTAPLRLRCPSVVTIHDLQVWHYPGDFAPLARWALKRLVRGAARRASRIITDSENTKRDVCSCLGVSPDRVAVIPLGVEDTPTVASEKIAAVRRTYGLTDDYLLCVSHSYPHKNLDGLVRAYEAARVAERYRLVIAGRPARGEASLRAAIRSAPHRERIVRLEWVPGDDLRALYAGATLFVFPSLFEGFGLPPLEAMAAGVPVVCSNRASLPEVVGEAALLVDVADAAALANAIGRALADEALRRSLVRKGFENLKRFSWETAARRTLAVFEEALSR